MAEMLHLDQQWIDQTNAAHHEQIQRAFLFGIVPPLLDHIQIVHPWHVRLWWVIKRAPANGAYQLGRFLHWCSEKLGYRKYDNYWD